jgi:hypothetical protein
MGPPPPPPPKPPPGPAGGSGGGRSTVEVAVPVASVGVIIGKGGGTIDSLQRESGARIKVTDQEAAPGSSERLVLITGTEREIHDAVSLIEDKLEASAEREAHKGGKALKAQLAAQKRKAAKGPPPVYEEVPVFDSKTGQLKVERRKVERSREEKDAAAMAELNASADEPSNKRPRRVQRYDKETGERTHFFSEDASEVSLNSLVESERRGARGGAAAMDGNTADSIARSKRYKGPISADDEYASRSWAPYYLGEVD